MKKIITILLITISVLAYGQEKCDQNTVKFDVEITGFRNYEGKILVQIFNENKEVNKEVIAEFKNKKCTFTVEGLKKGTYAVRYFHDENGDKEMGTNFMGIPKEGYGFSNNATAYFGPPDFKEWLFDLNEDKVLNLKISYLL